MRHNRGYTLVELMVAVGLFAIIMLIASGAYLMMIALNRQAQGIATGIDDLSFATELMTRNIRTGYSYSCGSGLGLGDCAGGGESFTFKSDSNPAKTITYSLAGPSSGRYIVQTVDGVSGALTDSAVSITSLKFYVFGTKTISANDVTQARMTMIVSGTVSSSANKMSQAFTIETGATMHQSDI